MHNNAFLLLLGWRSSFRQDRHSPRSDYATNIICAICVSRPGALRVHICDAFRLYMVMCMRVADDSDDDDDDVDDDDGPAGCQATTGARCCPRITFKSWECWWRDDAHTHTRSKGCDAAGRDSIASIGASRVPGALYVYI